MTAVQSVTLSNSVEMPLEGFGVFQVPDLAECQQATEWALEAGYRLIDTAAVYGNEEAVGAALKAVGLPRDEIFVTTKLWVQDMGQESGKRAFATSLAKLGLDHLDLYLIHQPFNDYYGAWRALEELYDQGAVRAIGVSNFYPDRLVDLALNSRITPMVNQVECHPFHQQTQAMATMTELGVHTQAWGPFAEGQNGIFTNPVLTDIGTAHGKSAAQVALRWNTQRGVSVLPKSVHRERIEANLDVWDFELSDQEMTSIAGLDGQLRIADHHAVEMVRRINGIRIHD